jgi:hypothetical protein
MKARNEMDTVRGKFAPNSVESEERQQFVFKGAVLLLYLGLFALILWSSARDDGPTAGCGQSEPAAHTACAENAPIEMTPFPAKGGTAVMTSRDAGHPLR